MKKNLITITRHPSVSCYVEEGTRTGKLRDNLVLGLLRGGYSARSLSGIGDSTFYLNYHNKPQAEKQLWIDRLRNICAFAHVHME